MRFSITRIVPITYSLPCLFYAKFRLDDLREVIWGRYQLQLYDLLREQHCTRIESDSDSADENDPPF